jgi:hypothetical protein
MDATIEPRCAAPKMRAVSILTLVLTAGCAALLLAVARHRPVDPMGFGAAIVVALGFLAAEIFPVHLRLRHDTHTLSFNELPLVAGLFLLTPAQFCVAVVAGSGLALYFHRRQRGVKLAFNVAQLGTQALLAVVVFGALRAAGRDISMRTYLAAIVAVLVADLVSAVLVSTAIALVRGNIGAAFNARVFLAVICGSLVKVSVSLLAVVAIARHNSFVLVLVSSGIAACYVALRGAALNRRVRQLQPY